MVNRRQQFGIQLKLGCSQQILWSPGSAVDRGLLAVDKMIVPELSTSGLNKFEVNS